MFFKSRCYNGGQQHKFVARVTASTTAPRMERVKGDGDDIAKMIEAMSDRKEVYHGDVCVWCGKVVNQQQA